MGVVKPKYYLSLADEVIDFSHLVSMPNMTDFLNLTLFTSMFENEEDLYSSLQSLGLIVDVHHGDHFSYVKRQKDNPDCEYHFVREKVVYACTRDYLHPKNIERFFIDNRQEYGALKAFFEDYMKSNEGLIVSFKRKIRELDETIKYAKIEQSTFLKEKRKKKENSLKNFLVYRDNLQNIIRLIDFFLASGLTKREEESEYISRLMRFVMNETYYVREHKMTPNFRGRAELGEKISELIVRYPRLKRPATKCYVYESLAVESAFRKVLKAQEEHITEEIPPASTPDPDAFMFLEKADFERMNEEGVEENLIIWENIIEKRIKLGL